MTEQTAPSTPEPIIRSLEERAFNAWPSLQTLVTDGWIMRFADGYTKRANSLNAWSPSAPIAAVLDTARDLYRRRGLPLVVRLSPLAGPSADATLASAGFDRIDETIVMTASLAGMAPIADAAVHILSSPERRWSEGFATANRVPEHHRSTHDAMLASLCLPAAFACLVEDGRPLAYGLAVAERGAVGLFDIVTAPEARRRGAGRRLVGSLLAWGAAAGCRETYLQVVATNAPAIALYRSLGYTEAYRYHYRVEPAKR